MNIFNNITKSVRILACSALTMGISACSLDEVPIPITVSDGSEGNISFLYEVEGDMPLTRGVAATPHEMKLKEVYILFFDESDNEIAGRYVGCSKTTSSPATSTIKFDLPDNLKENTEYRLIAIGNSDMYAGSAENYEDFLTGLSGDYSTVRTALLAEYNAAVTREDPGLLPLSGRFVGKADDQEMTFSFTKDGETYIYNGADECIFRFQRAICRVDLHNLVGNVLDIQQVRLVNTRTKGSFFVDGLNRGVVSAVEFAEGKLGPGAVDMPKISSDEGTLTGTRNTLQRLEAELYCFPNTVNTCLPYDKTTTALMISGYYTDPETNIKDDYLTYYRLNLNNAVEAQILQRNYCYRASIKGVTRRGDTDEQKAYNAQSPVFKYDIGEEWKTDDDNVVTDNDGNFLIVNKSMLTFTGDQCGADVIKLTVNTSDDMKWHIEMDDKSSELFSFKIINDGTEEKIQAFTCGPNQKNFSDHYYTGSLVVVAKKINKEDGKLLSELRKEIQLVQLTTSGDVKCLIVNDYASDFVQAVSMYGQTISYKIITGNPYNRWTADLISTENLDTNKILFNSGGTNANLFTITFPANIKEKGNIEIRFRFSCDDPDYNEGDVKDIIVRFEQDKSALPMSIEGWPNDVLTLDCFDTRRGYEYANCITQSKRFTVNLLSPKDHYVVVSSSFDQYRDLTLSEIPIGLETTIDVRSIHPGVSIVTGGADTDNGYYHNELNMKNTDKNTFYINAFRMGPGDVTISGQIKVQVFDRKTDEPVPDAIMMLTVNLEVPSDEYMINDVMIKNDLHSLGSDSIGNGWIYIMDRNIGCDARMHSEYGVTYKNEAMWCFYNQGDLTKDWIITNTCNYKTIENPTKWLGNLDFPIDISNRLKPTEANYTSWESILKNEYKHLGIMYEKAEKYPWLLMTAYTLPSIRKNTAISKGRHFILADDDLCPINSKKEKIHVACWLPSGGSRVGYAFTSSPSSQFLKTIMLCSNQGKLQKANFWPNNTGYHESNGDANAYYAHLVRLMYMIGYNKDGKGNAINQAYTLPEDSIESQKKYYKNHILQCYGPVKFE